MSESSVTQRSGLARHTLSSISVSVKWIFVGFPTNVVCPKTRLCTRPSIYIPPHLPFQVPRKCTFQLVRLVSTCMWPMMDLHPFLDTSGYPHLVIYPPLSLRSAGTTTSNATISVRLEAEYPVFNICMCYRPTPSTVTNFYHR